jgi:hypothetical protein
MQPEIACGWRPESALQGKTSWVQLPRMAAIAEHFVRVVGHVAAVPQFTVAFSSNVFHSGNNHSSLDR